MIDFYNQREEKYKKIIDDLKNDYSKEAVDKSFKDIENQNFKWINKIPIGSFFGRFILLIIISLGVSMYLNTQQGVPNYIFWILLVLSFLLSRFTISDRKNKKIMAGYENLLRAMPQEIKKEIDTIKSSMRFI